MITKNKMMSSNDGKWLPYYEGRMLALDEQSGVYLGSESES